MPSDALKAAADSNANVKLSGEVGTLTMDGNVSSNLASKGENVTVSISVADRTAFSPDIHDTVGDADVYELKALAGEESVHQLGGVVTVTVPYTLKPGDNPDMITVYYVNDEGKLSKKVTSYDPLTHTVTFLTDHFSYYMIAASDSLDIQSDEKEGDNTLVYVAIAAIAVIAVIAVVAYRRSS